MNNTARLAVCLIVALLFNTGIYLYFDRVLLAPTSAFWVNTNTDASVGGQAYYSRDRRYLAVTKPQTVEIYAMPGKKLVRTIELGTQRVSYFRWLEDRNLALMAIHNVKGYEDSPVVLSYINPTKQEHELTTTIKNVPPGSKIVDVAYSTATNVIYMQVQTSTNPNLYRVYRTDANHDLTRTYLTTSKIGRIGVLYDQDALIYDNQSENTVIARFGDGSWRVISPTVGKYHLVGVDQKNNIYIAKLNAEGLAVTILRGSLGITFETERTLQTPVPVSQLKVSDLIKQPAK